jgi:hypothetical protein
VKQDCSIALYCSNSVKSGEDIVIAVGIANTSTDVDLSSRFSVKVLVDGVLVQNSGRLRMPPPGHEDKLTLATPYKAQKPGVVQIEAFLKLEDSNLTNNYTVKKILVK